MSFIGLLIALSSSMLLVTAAIAFFKSEGCFYDDSRCDDRELLRDSFSANMSIN